MNIRAACIPGPLIEIEGPDSLGNIVDRLTQAMTERDRKQLMERMNIRLRDESNNTNQPEDLNSDEFERQRNRIVPNGWIVIVTRGLCR